MDKRKILIKKKFEPRIPPEQLEREKYTGFDRRKINDEFERDIAIDRAKLDLENAKHPRIHTKWHLRYIKAMREKLEAESIWSGKKASMCAHIRENPQRYGIKAEGRVTDQSVLLALPQHPAYRAGEKEYLDKYMACKDLEGKIGIIEGRGYILKNLSTLLDRGYFSAISQSQED